MLNVIERYAAATQIRTNKILHLFISSSEMQLLSTKINTYTCNPHNRKTLCAHGRPLHETKASEVHQDN
jgi:hypothetical protein